MYCCGESAGRVQVPLDAADFDACHQLPAKRGPAKVVAKFINRFKRDELFYKIKAARIKPSDCGWPQDPEGKKTVFVTEHLSPATARIFAAARQKLWQKNGGNYKYIWTRRGRVLLRTDDKADFVEVLSLEAVERIALEQPAIQKAE